MHNGAMILAASPELGAVIVMRDSNMRAKTELLERSLEPWAFRPIVKFVSDREAGVQNYRAESGIVTAAIRASTLGSPSQKLSVLSSCNGSFRKAFVKAEFLNVDFGPVWVDALENERLKKISILTSYLRFYTI